MVTIINKSIFTVGVHFLLLCGLSCSQYVDRILITSKTGSVIVEGSFAFVTCSWESDSYNKTTAILKDNILLTKDYKIIDKSLANRTSRYSYNRGSNSYLDFIATRQDAGYYECCVYDNPSTKDKLDCEGGALEVYYLSDPICTPLEKARILNGRQMTLSCLREYGNPTASLEWMGTKEYINSTALGKDIFSLQDGFIAANVTLDTTSEDINDIFTCTGSNGYLRTTCSTSVVTVWPSLAITPSQVVAKVYESVEFTCSSIDLKPSWEWDSQPRIDSSRVTMTTNVFSLTNVTLADNGTVINCYALYEHRWFKASAFLYVHENESFSHSDESSGQQFRDSSTGWKVGFSIVFIIMIVSIAGNVFQFWKFGVTTTSSASSSIVLSNNLAVATTKADTSGEIYTDLQKPNQPYTELQTPPQTPTKSKPVGSLVHPGNGGNNPKNDLVYEVDISTGMTGKQDNSDQIYDYAENDDVKHAYTNEKIGPRRK